MGDPEGQAKYYELIDIFEFNLNLYSENFKDQFNVGITIFPNEGCFDFIYSDSDKNPQAILMLGKVKSGEEYPAGELVSRYPGGVFDLSIYVKPEARNRGFAR